MMEIVMADVVVPGKWYAVVKCHNPDCGRGIALMEVPAPQEPEIPVEIQTPLSLPCPFCRSPGTWTATEVQRLQGSYVVQ
jgi:hypothetical protein